MRVSIIDEKTLKEIEKCRQALRTVLTKFTFGLADNMRWMPHSARELFESELERVNAEGQKLISNLLKGDAKAYIEERKTSLIADLNAMYQELTGQNPVPGDVIARVVESLNDRLTKALSANFMPKLTYSDVSFNVTSNTWFSPWGQAYSLLSDLALFPRKALTDPFFFRGLRVSEDDLIDAMDVADDILVSDRMKLRMKDRCKADIEVLGQIKKAEIDAREKCDLIWRLLRGEKATNLGVRLDKKVKEAKE